MFSSMPKLARGMKTVDSVKEEKQEHVLGVLQITTSQKRLCTGWLNVELYVLI